MVTVLPAVAVVAVFEGSGAPAEVTFGWFCFSNSSRGSSNRPRNKEVVVDVGLVVVSGVGEDWYMVVA